MSNEKKLPDAYAKSKDSNNYKLLKINELAAEELAANFIEVESSLDIKQASGETLDLFGAMFSVKRGRLNDTEYRIAIETKIAQNLCYGDINSVIDLFAQAFNCDKKNFIISDYPTHKVEIKRLPFNELSKLGVSVDTAIEMLNSILPVCVTITAYNYEGTLEFGDVDEYDEEKGLANVSQNVGGYFGLMPN